MLREVAVSGAVVSIEYLFFADLELAQVFLGEVDSVSLCVRPDVAKDVCIL